MHSLFKVELGPDPEKTYNSSSDFLFLQLCVKVSVSRPTDPSWYLFFPLFDY